MSAKRSLTVARLVFGVLCCAVAPTMLLKQFQGLETVFGLNDKAAHVLAFYSLSVALFIVAPRARRSDLCFLALAAALAVELLQHFTGRSVSLGDFLAGALGIAGAWAPGLAEELRRAARGERDRRHRVSLSGVHGGVSAPMLGRHSASRPASRGSD